MEAHVELSKKLRSLLKQNPSLALDSKKQRIRCSLFGHEMACNEEAVLSYISGKKFQKARARDNSNYDQYKPHIIPSTRRYHEQLFCSLTLRHINKTPEHVQRHVNGGRYKRALARWRECQEKGIQFVPYQRTFRKVNTDEEPSKDGEDNLGNEDEGEQSASEEELDTTAEKEELDKDNFDDLYPAEDFKDDKEEEEDSDFDFDEEDLDDSKKTKPVKSVKASGSKKRKGSDCDKDGEDLNDGKESKPVQSDKASEAKKRKKEKKKQKKNKKKQITG